MALLLTGVLLRIVYCAGNDVRHVHDDHFHVVRIIAEEHRWPRPDEGWETYQPPLYHALGAVTYTCARAIASALGAGPDGAHFAGRKAVQFISAVAGSVTLVFIWLMLRDVFGAQRGLALLGLAVAAFLPRHVYLSAMATNDALATLWMTVSLWALLRWHETRGRLRWALVASVTCGLAMLTKAYGLATFGVLVLAIVIAIVSRWRRTADSRAEAHGTADAQPGTQHVSRALVSGGAMLALAIAAGIWPYARNARLAGSPFVSNYDLIPHAIWHQPPGRAAEVSFTSFRLPSLMDRPWLHVSTLDSFWTQIYARTWFDYGTKLTLFHYRPFVKHISRAWADDRKSPRERFVDELTWETHITPDAELAAGRALLALGIVPTLLLLIGLVIGSMRLLRSFPLGLMAVNLLANLAIPIFQTLRQPHYSSMKATFAVGALASGAVLVAVGADALGWHKRAWLRWLVIVNVVLLALVLTAHLVQTGFFPPDYYIDPNDRI